MTDKKAKALVLGALLVAAASATADDWPAWGRTYERNFSCAEEGLPSSFVAGDYVGASDEIDPSTTKNVKWIAKLGSQSYGNPTVANGRIYVGTNNDVPRDERFEGDRCCVYCFDEATGEFLWELNVPKLGTGKVSDWEYLGICSSPTIDGDRIYLLTNRCEVICLDVNGMRDGNQGFDDEGLLEELAESPAHPLAGPRPSWKPPPHPQAAESPRYQAMAKQAEAAGLYGVAALLFEGESDVARCLGSCDAHLARVRGGDASRRG